MSVNLSEILLATRIYAIDSIFLELGENTAVSFPRLPRPYFHLVISGTATLELADGAVEMMSEGEFRLITHGMKHTIRTAHDVKAQTLPCFHQPLTLDEPRVFRFGEGAKVKLNTGVFGLDQIHDGPSRTIIPEIIRLVLGKSSAGVSFPLSDGAEAFEAACKGPGAHAFVSASAHILQLQALRRYLSSDFNMELAEKDFLGGPPIGFALRLINSQPSRCWTLKDLAGAVGMSRSAFAEAFHESVGETPMHYISARKLTWAREYLSEGISVGDAARMVGFKCLASFSRAYKRFFGRTPSEDRYRSYVPTDPAPGNPLRQ